jgi:hypothetical protein
MSPLAVALKKCARDATLLWKQAGLNVMHTLLQKQLEHVVEHVVQEMLSTSPLTKRESQVKTKTDATESGICSA